MQKKNKTKINSNKFAIAIKRVCKIANYLSVHVIIFIGKKKYKKKKILLTFVGFALMH